MLRFFFKNPQIKSSELTNVSHTIFFLIANIIYNYKSKRSTSESFVNLWGGTLRKNLLIFKVRQKRKINHKKNKEASPRRHHHKKNHQKTKTPYRHHHDRKNTRHEERGRSTRGRTKQLESLQSPWPIET
jgi:hypothetical protein